MTMDELKPKQSAFIRSVGGTGALRHHLLDMGLTPKTEVTLQKIAPMGDPVQIELRGYELTLRLDEAQKITVEKVHTKAEKNHATQRTMAVEHPGVGELGRANSYHVHNAANEISEGAKITFALVGNQNCGKTTLFNQLTGANGGSVRVNELEEILGIPVVPIPCFIGIIALVFVMTFSFIGAALSDLMGMGIDTVIALLDGMLAKAQVNPVVHSLVIAFVCLKVRDKKICAIGISWQL